MRVSHVRFGEKSIPGRRNSRYRGSKAETGYMFEKQIDFISDNFITLKSENSEYLRSIISVF